MKKIRLVGLFFALFHISINSIITPPAGIPPTTRQVIVHFSGVPKDEKEHGHWNKQIEDSLHKINDKLIKDGFIAPQLDALPAGASWWHKLEHWIKHAYYALFYRTHTIKYPKKENFAFFTRTDRDLGYYAMHIPDGVPYAIFVKQLKEIYSKDDVPFHVDKDAPIHITYSPDIGLEGKGLTLEELEQLKQEIATEKKATSTAESDFESLSTRDQMKEVLFWHQWFPTTGLRLKEPFYPPAYPYLPHYFSLWQLAPNKGAGIRVADIDTGVAAFSIQGDDQYRKNQDLSVSIGMGEHNFNLVSENGLDPLEQFVHTVQQYVDPKKFAEEALNKKLPAWIKAYLEKNSDEGLRTYLKKNGKKELLNADGTLNKKGQAALKDLLTGKYGIAPGKTNDQSFVVKELENKDKEKVIVEFLPAPRITDQKTTFIAGHGTHTFGLIGAKQQNDDENVPGDDSGIVGIAPKADVFMIKAFQDNGVTDKSTLIAGLKKAIVHNADIVNMSLKVADNLDLSDESSQLLNRVVTAIPFVIAASGNNGDPKMPNYAGKVEAYPARFSSVPFDVGSFSYKDDKAPISFFSQYEPGVGPLFVAPGFNILSSGLVPGQTVDSEYVFMAGTSMATPIISGFVALMLGEFKNDFDRDQLLKVCYASAIKLHDNQEWQNKVALGVLDMRTALFTLRVLKRLKEILPGTGLGIDFKGKFDYLVKTIIAVLHAPTVEYGSKHLGGANFKANYMDYFVKAQKNKNKYNQSEYFKRPTINSVDDAVSYVVNTILAALGTEPKGAKGLKTTVDQIKKIFALKKVDLLEGVDPRIKKRIIQKEAQHPYWSRKAKELRARLIKSDIANNKE